MLPAMSLKMRMSGGAAAVVAAAMLVAGCKTQIGAAHDLGGTDLSVNDMAVPGDQAVPIDMADNRQDIILPPDAVVAVTYAELLQMFEAAYCNNLVKCGQLDSSRVTQCLEVARGLKVLSIDPNVEIQEGRIVLNDATCAQAYGNARCDGTNVGAIQTTSCQNLFLPKQTKGQACISDLECKSGYCVTNGDDAGTDYGSPGGCTSPGGHCEPYIAINSACTASAQCDPTTSFCNGVTCQAYVADNAACTYVAYAAGAQPCLPGAFCKITTMGATMGTCVRPTASGSLGDNCDEWQDDVTAFPSCAQISGGAQLYCSHLVADQVNGLPACANKIAQGQPCSPTATLSVTDPAAVPCVKGTECYHQVGDTTGVTLCHPEVALNVDSVSSPIRPARRRSTPHSPDHLVVPARRGRRWNVPAAGGERYPERSSQLPTVGRERLRQLFVGWQLDRLFRHRRVLRSRCWRRWWRVSRGGERRILV